MLKESSYLEKLKSLDPWLSAIIDVVKKDLKNEHLKADPAFLKKHFKSKVALKMPLDELIDGYRQALQEDNEPLAEYIANRWLLKNSDIYDFFASRLQAINPEFHQMEHLEEKAARTLMEEGVRLFGPLDIYLFAVLNSVVFPSSIFEQLKTMAQEKESSKPEDKDLESLQQAHFSLQLERLKEKYEKKLLGLERKYLADTKQLKQQIAQLQRKLNGAA